MCMPVAWLYMLSQALFSHCHSSRAVYSRGQHFDLRAGIEREVLVAVRRRVDEPLHQLLVHDDHVQLQDLVGGLQQPGLLEQPWEKGPRLCVLNGVEYVYMHTCMSA